MSLRKQYKVNAQRQEQGAPVHLPPNDDGSVPCIWVRRVTSADGAVAKWENVTLADVKDDDKLEGFAEPTLENKMALLTLLPELHADLRTFAYQRANYLEACIEADAKNS